MEKSKEAILLHMCLLKIACEIKRICEKHDIKYFLIGGTLLGAVRHQGIIPWDDDLDIGMIRSDYEKFIRICDTELSDEFFLSNSMEEKKYGVSFAKVRLNGTSFIDKGVPTTIHNGIFVDVFPIDCMPDDPRDQELQKRHVHFWRNVLAAKCSYGVICKRVIIRKILLFAFTLLPKKYIIRKLDFWQGKYNGHKCNNYINFASAYKYGKEIFPWSSLDGTLNCTVFENEEFPTPKNSHDILTHIYGDYMKFPPAENRIFKHVSSTIDFGIYENMFKIKNK